jgi:hypothetical protein
MQKVCKVTKNIKSGIVKLSSLYICLCSHCHIVIWYLNPGMHNLFFSQNPRETECSGPHVHRWKLNKTPKIVFSYVLRFTLEILHIKLMWIKVYIQSECLRKSYEVWNPATWTLQPQKWIPTEKSWVNLFHAHMTCMKYVGYNNTKTRIGTVLKKFTKFLIDLCQPAWSMLS